MKNYRNKTANFSIMPSVNVKRSTVNRPFNHKFTFNTGDLVPFYVEEVIPGSTVQLNSASQVRLTTSIHPTIDNLFLDTYFFFVPYRLCYVFFEQIIGGSSPVGSQARGCKAGLPSDWLSPAVGEYSLPPFKKNGVLGIPKANLSVGSLFDYMGVPIPKSDDPDDSVYYVNNCMPFQAYNLIYNEWFRDENLIDAINYDFNANASSGINPDNYIIRKAAKFHDYFTSALIKPQKGDAITIPIGQNAPVVFEDFSADIVNNGGSMLFTPYEGSLTASGNVKIDATNPNDPKPIYSDASSTGGIGNLKYYSGLSIDNVQASGYADLSQATATTINELRLLFATQKWLEKNAMYGTRFTEILRSHFGCAPRDDRLNRPEYLGGSRQLLDMRQITQTSASVIDPTNPSSLGQTAGQSVSVNKSGTFIKSFTEPGVIIGLMVARPSHTYQYGLNKLYSRSNRLSFYWPEFAHIGYQPILNREIYMTADSGTGIKSVNDEAFAYQEAWSEYRYSPNRISGYFRSRAGNSIADDTWHYADKYDDLPHLGSEWIQETKTNVDRTLAVSGDSMHQLMCNLEIRSKWTIPLPVNSIPGLIDHF